MWEDSPPSLWSRLSSQGGRGGVFWPRGRLHSPGARGDLWPSSTENLSGKLSGKNRLSIKGGGRVNYDGEWRMFLPGCLKVVTKLVPSLKPQEECTMVPRQVCSLEFSTPSKVLVPLQTKWCLSWVIFNCSSMTQNTRLLLYKIVQFRE